MSEEQERPPRRERRRGPLRENNGKLSATRIMFLMWSVAVLVVWVAVSIKRWEMAAPPWEVVGILATFGGVKIGQKYGEEKPGG